MTIISLGKSYVYFDPIGKNLEHECHVDKLVSGNYHMIIINENINWIILAHLLSVFFFFCKLRVMLLYTYLYYKILKAYLDVLDKKKLPLPYVHNVS